MAGVRGGAATDRHLPHVSLQSLLAPAQGAAPPTPPAAAQQLVPAYVMKLFDVVGKIGEGTYGVVYLARSRGPHPCLLAVKTFKPGKEGDGVSPTAIREIMLLRELRHAHIVRLDSVHICRQDTCLSLAFEYAEHDLYEDASLSLAFEYAKHDLYEMDPSLSLAFEYAEHDLYEMVRHHRTGHGLEAYTLKSLMAQLLAGLAHLHAGWIMHRDLKPSNVLVMGDGPQQGRVKLADMGLARIFAAPLRPLSDNGVVVTIWYRAPELLLGARHYTPAADVWAAGCILAELLALRPLFQGDERKQPGTAFQAGQCDKIFRVLGLPSAATWPELEHLPHWRQNTEDVRSLKPEHPPAPRLPEYLAEHSAASPAGSATQAIRRGSAAMALLEEMLQYNPAQRITPAQALQHPYFKEEPLPGPNAFVQHGRQVAHYPRRTRYAPANAPPAAPPAPGGGSCDVPGAPGASSAPGPPGMGPTGASGRPTLRHATPQGVVRHTTPAPLAKAAAPVAAAKPAGVPAAAPPATKTEQAAPPPSQPAPVAAAPPSSAAAASQPAAQAAPSADCVPLGSTLVGGSCAAFVGAFKDRADSLAGASDAALRSAVHAATAPDASCCSDATAFVNGGCVCDSGVATFAAYYNLNANALAVIAKAAQMACPNSRVVNPCTGPAPPADASALAAVAG
ncbi:hypothetical protein WJX81_008266 [Elliptochloris bilobata]|uniref:Cyclin-dependent kinase 8 n=1 Tax=Elliptochloris bilobata TaxID=381761 RepID=A0AAW1QM26_9CHLO